MQDIAYGYTCQEGNVIISVVIHDLQEEPTIRVGNEELSLEQWNRLCGRIIYILEEEIE